MFKKILQKVALILLVFFFFFFGSLSIYNNNGVGTLAEWMGVFSSSVATIFIVVQIRQSNKQFNKQLSVSSERNYSSARPLLQIRDEKNNGGAKTIFVDSDFSHQSQKIYSVFYNSKYGVEQYIKIENISDNPLIAMNIGLYGKENFSYNVNIKRLEGFDKENPASSSLLIDKNVNHVIAEKIKNFILSIGVKQSEMNQFLDYVGLYTSDSTLLDEIHKGEQNIKEDLKNDDNIKLIKMLNGSVETAEFNQRLDKVKNSLRLQKILYKNFKSVQLYKFGNDEFKVDKIIIFYLTSMREINRVVFQYEDKSYRFSQKDAFLENHSSKTSDENVYNFDSLVFSKQQKY